MRINNFILAAAVAVAPMPALAASPRLSPEPDFHILAYARDEGCIFTQINQRSDVLLATVLTSATDEKGFKQGDVIFDFKNLSTLVRRGKKIVLPGGKQPLLLSEDTARLIKTYSRRLKEECLLATGRETITLELPAQRFGASSKFAPG